jgi:hypothetical protein
LSVSIKKHRNSAKRVGNRKEVLKKRDGIEYGRRRFTDRNKELWEKGSGERDDYREEEDGSTHTSLHSPLELSGFCALRLPNGFLMSPPSITLRHQLEMSRHVLFVLPTERKKEAPRMSESIDVRSNKADTFDIQQRQIRQK